MILRAACAALVLSAAACSSSGGAVSAKPSSARAVSLPRKVTCAEFVAASSVAQSVWTADLLETLSQTGAITVADAPGLLASSFSPTVVKACRATPTAWAGQVAFEHAAALYGGS